MGQGHTVKTPAQNPPYPWVVPLVLLCGIAASLYFRWPLFTGLVIAFIGAFLYAVWIRYPLRAAVHASLRGIQTMLKVCVVLICIGGVVALWMDAGVIPYMTELGATYINGHNILWLAFVLAAVLSLVIGSSIATWSVLGPPLFALAPVSMAPLLAGALVSGGMVGDRASPMSSSAVLMSSITGVSHSKTLKHLLTTAVPPVMATGMAFWALNAVVHPAMPTVHVPPAGSPVCLLLPLILVLLACCRMPLLYNLTIALVLGFGFSILVNHGPVLDVLTALWHGASPLVAGTQHPIGGVRAMLSAVWLIAAAGAFQGVTTLSRSVDALTRRILERIQGRFGFTFVSYGLCAMFSLVMGSQMVSILMTNNTLAPQCERRNLPKEALLQVVSDGAELFPCVIPWNLLGLQTAVIFHVSTFTMAPYAWYVYLTLLYSIWRFLHHWQSPTDLHRPFSVLTP